MWIVKLGDNRRHSAWDTKREALHQARVLEDYGCIRVDLTNGGSLSDFVEEDITVQCENGHYYV